MVHADLGRWRNGWLAVGYWLLLVSLRPAEAADEGQHPELLDVQVRVQMQYLLYLPPDYEQRDSWPLLIFLHGMGECGTDLERVKVHGPPHLIAEGKSFPMIVVPLERSQQMVGSLLSRGAHPRFTVYSQVDHDSWVAAYKDERLYHWLLQQHR